ncbi:RNase adapter RapZ [Thermanaeromonas sp. C210]|uniref:RNase adapter RapZ n=1 Tax=Thermanaeromonas sp. C210 TaxID=2731925 RepID=UPI00155CE7CE|nr:RNase adapter RapZ [Thermanaeromonas sp. C210]GFN22727.1 nucleotide-binding protein [Thermanaeromonas sp. C210]
MQGKRNLRLVIVTGLSGAGKTQAIRFLEDLGFFCIDNLPPSLIPGLVELLNKQSPPSGENKKVALVMDIRGGAFFEGLEEALGYLDSQGFPYEILFLEASDDILVRRYKETRRRHPLAGESILEGILEERRRLQEIKGRASKIIDTSELTPRQLKEQIMELFGGEREQLTITVESFGYKYGIPLDADLVLDVRFLPNPYYVPALRPFTGHDRCVADFVLDSPVTSEFIARFMDLMHFLIPHYVKEGKSHLVIAIGCTGGQHRSVTLANTIGELLKGPNRKVIVKHRDVMHHSAGHRRR